MVGFSLMVGIAGWRAHAHRSGEYVGRVFRDCTPQERAALGAGPQDLAVRCLVTRRKTGQAAMEFDGFGLYRTGREKSKMNPLQCVRTRAERDAMKAAFPLGLGGGMAGPVRIVDEESGEIVDAEAVTVDASEPVTYGAQPPSSDAESPVNGQGASADRPGRPYPPDVLKARLAERAAGYGDREASSKQRGLVAAMLEACFAGEADSEQKRHALLFALRGIESVKGLPGADVLALLDWLSPSKDSGGAFMPDPMAAQEARRAALAGALAEAGQLHLQGMVEGTQALGGVAELPDMGLPEQAQGGKG